MPESIAFIENAVRRNPTRPGHSIGLRTSKWKYYRSLDDSTKDISLYDLENDPNEEKNIAKDNPKVVSTMEEYLTKWKNKSDKTNSNKELSKDEIEKAKDILLKLGYI